MKRINGLLYWVMQGKALGVPGFADAPSQPLDAICWQWGRWDRLKRPSPTNRSLLIDCWNPTSNHYQCRDCWFRERNYCTPRAKPINPAAIKVWSGADKLITLYKG